MLSIDYANIDINARFEATIIQIREDCGVKNHFKFTFCKRLLNSQFIAELFVNDLCDFESWSSRLIID